MDLNGTSAIVTGGASGLGLATSRLLAERGVRVVVADLQEDKGVPLAKEIGGLFVQTDVTNPEQVITAVDAAVEMAPLRSLVNGRPLGARCISPSRCLTAVPIAMNSAMLSPQS